MSFAHAAGDRVKPENNIARFLARTAGASDRLHIYSAEGAALDCDLTRFPCSIWPERCAVC